MNSLICGHVTRPSPFIFVTKQKLKTVLFCTSLSPSYTILLSSVSHLDILLPILPKHSFAAISSSAVQKTHRFTQSWAQIITAVILVLDEVRLRNRSSVETSLVFWPPWLPNWKKIEIQVSEPLRNPHINIVLQLNQI